MMERLPALAAAVLHANRALLGSYGETPPVIHTYKSTQWGRSTFWAKALPGVKSDLELEGGIYSVADS